jgi:hypothetical protein
MKRFTGFNKAALPIAAALILLLVASGPVAFGGFEEPLRLVSHKIVGQQVFVEVVNSSSKPASDQVWVEAKVDGEVIHGLVSVTVFGKQTATVVVGFPSAVEDVVNSGLVSEGPSPF